MLEFRFFRALSKGAPRRRRGRATARALARPGREGGGRQQGDAKAFSTKTKKTRSPRRPFKPFSVLREGAELTSRSSYSRRPRLLHQPADWDEGDFENATLTIPKAWMTSWSCRTPSQDLCCGRATTLTTARLMRPVSGSCSSKRSAPAPQACHGSSLPSMICAAPNRRCSMRPGSTATGPRSASRTKRDALALDQQPCRRASAMALKGRTPSPSPRARRTAPRGRAAPARPSAVRTKAAPAQNRAFRGWRSSIPVHRGPTPGCPPRRR